MSDELAILLGKRFLERRDVKAVQHKDGSWTPDRSKDGQDLKWTMPDLRNHLAGTRTLGHYLTSPENKTKLFAFDLDLKKSGFTCPIWQDDEEHTTALETVPCNPREIWLDADNPGRTLLTIQLRCTADALAERTHRLIGCHVAISTSGNKGLHVYAFTGSILAEEAREAAQLVLDSFRDPITDDPIFVPLRGSNFYGRPESETTNLEIEVFPKQEKLENRGYGNLMALPLGVHRKTGNRKRFLTSNAPYEKLVSKDAVAVLEGELPWD